MDSFLARSNSDKLRIYTEASAKLRLPADYIEKDIWVCWGLRELFALPEWGDKLTFKGGTSLSKGYQLIERFSEDIDVTIGREALGFESDLGKLSKSQRKKALEGLKEKSKKCVEDELLPAFREVVLQKALNATHDAVSMDTNAEDGQTILFKYPSVFGGSGSYVMRTVKLEFGARADTWPVNKPVVSCYLSQIFPKLFQNAKFEVQTLAPERTFWEKVMLLHEWTYMIENGKELRTRQARHYYDIWCLINKGIAEKAAADISLFESIREHRRVFFPATKVDYDLMCAGSLRIVPLDGQRAAWEKDYVQMDEMFFEQPPSFDKLLMAVKDFEDRFNS